MQFAHWLYSLASRRKSVVGDARFRFGDNEITNQKL